MPDYVAKFKLDTTLKNPKGKGNKIKISAPTVHEAWKEAEARKPTGSTILDVYAAPSTSHYESVISHF